MPIFDFKCITCNQVTEYIILSDYNSDDGHRCTQCKSRLIQVVSAPAAIINHGDISYTNKRRNTEYGKLQSS